MIPAGRAFNVIDANQVKMIHHSALRILEEMGMQIQNKKLLLRLADRGLPVDLENERVRFPSPFVEQFIADTEKYDWENVKPSIGSSAGVYHSLFHDPMTNQLVPWNEDRLAFYFSLARRMSHIGSASTLGSRVPVPDSLEALYERYFCWKYGATEGGSINIDEMCPYLYDLYQVFASERHESLQQVFRGTVYLVPAMKLGVHEAYQIAYFLERGLHVHIGSSMMTMGANAPVTLAGAVTLNLAEQLALRILDWVLFGEKHLSLYSSLSVLDMRSTIRPFGAPEMAIANLMTAQIARFYGASFSGHGGLTDSKLPSVESGAQKAMTALPTLMVSSSFWLDAGLLGIDEVCSPVQMILDNEFLSAIKRFVQEYEVTPETIGLELILKVGPAGNYVDKMHTVRYFRNEHWRPSIWSRQMLNPWLAEGCRLDVDKAREMALDIQKQPLDTSGMSEGLEQEVLKIIERAKRDLSN